MKRNKKPTFKAKNRNQNVNDKTIAENQKRLNKLLADLKKGA